MWKETQHVRTHVHCHFFIQWNDEYWHHVSVIIIKYMEYNNTTVQNRFPLTRHSPWRSLPLLPCSSAVKCLRRLPLLLSLLELMSHQEVARRCFWILASMNPLIWNQPRLLRWKPWRHHLKRSIVVAGYLELSPCAMDLMPNTMKRLVTMWVLSLSR